MIPGGCHSNGFSDGTGVCSMDVSGVAFNNHPGTAALGGRAAGWRPWLRANGRGVEAGEARRTTVETSFWLHKPGTHGAPAVEESYYDRPRWCAQDWHNPQDDVKRVYYLSKIGSYSCNMTCTPAQTGREVHKSGYLFGIRPRCDRLLLAENVTFTQAGALDTSAATLRWYAPRKRSNFGNTSNLDATLRPFIHPDHSIAGWPDGEAPFASSPPFAPYYYADWRWNPKKPPHRYVWHEQTSVYQDLEDLKNWYTPAEIRSQDWGDWSTPEDGVMLYMLDRDERTTPPGPWYSIYWQEGPAFEPENFDTSRLLDGLKGVDAYSGFHAAICVDSVSNDDIWTDGHGNDLFRKGDAFDLRLYCQTYYYKVWHIDPATGTPTKIGPPCRFYFNTMVHATIRQLVPVPPA